MLFNSLDFAIFLPVVFLLYWFVFQKKLKQQNTLLLIVSYVFYGWWDWRFLLLIIFSSFIDYTVALKLKDETKDINRKVFLWISIAVNLGFLGFFKYYNFFVDNFVAVFSLFGSKIQSNTLNIILPVGISFYTFQTLSYTIDVYKKKLEPTKDIVSFFAFISFFPQLVAGPIERATNLLPQFYKIRKFEYKKAVDGCRQILWGLFKKVVIADSCAEYANVIFNNYVDYSGSTLIMGALFFTFQIYGDFSGYSDIAIGTARLLGFNLKQNFAFPYFSRDVAEFWRRWHISLSTWFRDYVYIPLGGSRVSKWLKVRNIFVIFIVSGFWHGANWTYIIWGFLNALYFIPLLLTNRNRYNLDVVAENKILPNIKELLQIIVTFLLIVMSWVFFRSESVPHAIGFLKNLFIKNLFKLPEIRPSYLIVLIMCFICIEWCGRHQKYALEQLFFNKNKILRLGFYMILIVLILIFSNGTSEEFIYFQF
ncbi:MBOAT family O-acyltransferase [Hyunsoonleella ulvae]|uniref:MBOAT family O-acyltransferase n=1 Tax=Hyunsoonleella ulvae TaxID=2799948 RepID=UPI00193AC8D7|nr:MBOAT family protein [Hyunsoonleella ulvae]